MTNEDIVEVLIERIKNGKINPVTGQPFKLEDIKIEEFKTAVATKLEEQKAQTEQPTETQTAE